MPKVSIITPLFNGANYIEECIRSVQAQTEGDYEHLIIDNMSTDEGAKIVTGLSASDPRIKLLRNEASQGAAATRNAGIVAADGQYIAFLDCDDAWKKDKLEKQISAMELTGAAFSWTGYDVTDDTGKYIRTQSAQLGNSYDLISKKMVIGCLTAIYDQSQVGKMEMTYLVIPEDLCLWVDILGKIEREGLTTTCVSESLAVYRVHSNGVSSNKLKAAKAHWRALRDHVKLTPCRAAMAFVSYAVNAVSVRVRKNKAKCA